jgi:hypothetical protein
MLAGGPTKQAWAWSGRKAPRATLVRASAARLDQRSTERADGSRDSSGPLKSGSDLRAANHHSGQSAAGAKRVHRPFRDLLTVRCQDQASAMNIPMQMGGSQNVGRAKPLLENRI